MTFTDSDVRTLRAAHPNRGWQEVDSSCPAHVLQTILEWRALRLPEFRSAVVRGPQGEALPTLVATDLKQRLAELSIL
jgi:hypothetical protein